MKANIKGFIRNVVNDVLEKLVEEECLYDRYGISINMHDDDFNNIKEIADEVTENYLDCIEEESD